MTGRSRRRWRAAVLGAFGAVLGAFGAGFSASLRDAGLPQATPRGASRAEDPAARSAAEHPASEASRAPVVFTDVTILPMDRHRVLDHHTVIVRDSLIVALGPSARVPVPAGATVIDGRGKYLVPGFADMHVHLASDRETNIALLRLFTENGVTTVLNLKGAPEHLALRRDVARGVVPGPTLYTAGPYVNEPFVTTPDEVERAVVAQKRAGYDVVKMHGDLSREAYARLMAVGRREGIPVVGHSPRALGYEAMFAERQYAAVHAEEFIYDRTGSSRDFLQLAPKLPSIAHDARAAGLWLMPNLTAFRNIAGQIGNLDSMNARPEMATMPRAIRESWGPATNGYTRRFPREMYGPMMARSMFLSRLTSTFRDSGVRLLVGTDALNTGTVPGTSLHDELALLVDEAGLTPYEALRAATANAAEFLRASDRVGTIAVGKRADLVLLDANPLVRIANTRRIAGVMVRGRWSNAARR